MTELPNPNKLDEVGKPFPHNDNVADDPLAPPPTVEPAWQHSNYYAGATSRAPSPDQRGGDFTPLTWAMIVVAGIALGFVIAMTFAGA